MTFHLLDVQQKVISILHQVQEQSSIERYTNDLKICMRDNADNFNPWFLSAEKVVKLTNINPPKVALSINTHNQETLRNPPRMH